MATELFFCCDDCTPDTTASAVLEELKRAGVPAREASADQGETQMIALPAGSAIRVATDHGQATSAVLEVAPSDSPELVGRVSHVLEEMGFVLASDGGC